MSFENRAQALAELEREFHQAQSLSHPNIASVFDLDKDEGTYFIVMELLEGDLLTNILRRLSNRPMSRAHALGLINSIGSALAYAHRREISHGDLKPRNVMVTSDGEVRVLEFGFAHARALGAGEIDGAHEGVAIGTPAYASSERVHGFEPDPSDDVYSFACIAYELLSGRHPYGGRSALLARAHGKRASRISWLNHRQWHALQRALAWDRADRKIDVADLLVALGAAEVKNDPVPPELLSIPDDAGARRRRLFAMLAAVVLAVVFGVYMITRIPPPVQSIEAAHSTMPQVKPEPVPAQNPGATSPSSTSTSTQPTEEVTAPVVAAATGTAAPAPQTNAPPATNLSAARSGSIQFEKDTFVVTESDGSVSVQVQRTGSTRGILSFRWTLRANSAEAGADYAGIGPGLEQIPSGVSTATITVPLVSDAIMENTELFLVEIEALDEGVTVGELGHAAVIIVDDD
jgi:serine/threonine protein kinase